MMTGTVRRPGVPVALACLLCLVLAAAATEPPTPFELSGGKATPRYAETVAWCRELADASPLLNATGFGVSPQGRDLPLVVADGRGRFTAAEHGDRGDELVVLVQACIHAGESCGKDAGMQLLRDLVADGDAHRWLDRVTLLFVPIFNVDGHERFGPYGRINQNGPEEMGWRVTANNLNLNRDFLKADTSEMRAWLALWRDWWPDFLVDVHSTDGADYQYALTYGLQTAGALEAGLTAWTKAYRDSVCDRMAADGFPLSPYVAFVDWQDPHSGLKQWVAGPRFSQGYAAICNRPALLIETHMLKPYAVRVEATRLMLAHTLDLLRDGAGTLRARISAADALTAGAAFRAQPFALDFALTDHSRPVDFLGYACKEVTSEITGGTWSDYGAEPETLRIAFFDRLAPSVTVSLPEAYIVPPEWTDVIDRLRQHGVALARLDAPAELEIGTYRFTDATWRERPYEGRHPVDFTVQPLVETRILPTGSVVVDLAQPLARVAAHLLEPEGPDSLVRWGFFDAVFEPVEYVEAYVIERMIPELLAADPRLAERLAARKLADPEFAADPWAIRTWFYEQTPFFDQRAGLYPVGRIVDRAALSRLHLTDCE